MPKIACRLMLRVIALTVSIGSCAGCGPQVCTVQGRVVYMGQPVTSGSVVLYCQNQQIVRAAITPDGTYAVPNVPPGSVRITVTSLLRTPDALRRKYPMPPVINGPIMPEVGRPAKDVRMPAIPHRYGVPEESGLSVTVDRGVTEFDIVLTP
jgi:hypothetical protein